LLEEAPAGLDVDEWHAEVGAEGLDHLAGLVAGEGSAVVGELVQRVEDHRNPRLAFGPSSLACTQ